MDRERFRPAMPWITSVIALSVTGIIACNSSSVSRTGEERAATAPGATGPHFDVMCVADRINHPPAPFHYSYKYTDTSGSVDKEADIAPQTMNITIQDNSGLHSYHGLRSDEVSWNSAVLDLSGLRITAMLARLDSLNDSSAITNKGTQAMNGYDTTKYAIDTISADASDKQQFEALFGKGSFERGAIWIQTDGCAVKLILDEGISQTDGSVNKAHYEMAMVKK